MEYTNIDLRREDIDVLPGATLLEFGVGWCGYCARAQTAIEIAITQHGGVRHLKVEDGKGRRLGRSFGVKFWPTLIFLKDGVELTRLVRPTESGPIIEGLAEIDSGTPARPARNNGSS